VQLDLVASGRARSFSMFTAVPGFRGDYHASGVFSASLRAGADRELHRRRGFPAALEALPCCATNNDGSKKGDPLNLVVVGGLDDAFPALVRRGWRPTEETWSGSIMRMASSFLSGERYPYAPVSNLYLFGRSQDLALQKARDNIHQRNHLRLWLSPMLYHGRQVWVGQISRDIGSRLTIHTPTLTTHKIDPDVEKHATRSWRTWPILRARQDGAGRGVGAAARCAPRETYHRPVLPTVAARWCSTAGRFRSPRSILPWLGVTKAMNPLRLLASLARLRLAGCAIWQAPAAVSDSSYRRSVSADQGAAGARCWAPPIPAACSAPS
jgi:hypothetical protein